MPMIYKKYMLNLCNYTEANNIPQILTKIKRNKFHMNSGLHVVNTMKILEETKKEQ